MKIRMFVPLCGIAIFLVAHARADVRVPSVISNNAVLQQGVKVPIWGWAAPGEKVTVSATPIQALTKLKNPPILRATATPNKEGSWQVKLGPFPMGLSLSLTIQGKKRPQQKLTPPSANRRDDRARRSIRLPTVIVPAICTTA